METKQKMPKAMKIITAILCVILSLVLISNLVVIIKGSIDPDRPPSIFGFTSMIVLTASMDGPEPNSIAPGDMIITKPVNVDELAVGDIITYMENGKTTVTHRIIGLNEDGTFQTKGDANNAADDHPVTKDEVIGLYWFRIPKLGDVALFAQTPTGLLVFIGIPLVIYILLDVILRGVENKKKKKEDADSEAEKEDLEKQLAELKAKMAEAEASKEETPAPAETGENVEA